MLHIINKYMIMMLIILHLKHALISNLYNILNFDSNPLQSHENDCHFVINLKQIQLNNN